MNVICYKRVSTDDQADRGFSLQHQEDMLRRYCDINHYDIVDIYTEDYSAKTFDRPEWKKIMTFVQQNKNLVDAIVFLRWDRFSRNLYESLTMIRKLQKMGVLLISAEQPLDLSNPDSKMMLSFYLSMPEIENDKNSIRTTEGSRRARLEGCWTGTAPKGYVNCRTESKKSTLKPSSDAPLIVEAFNRMSSGAYSADEVRRWLNSKGMKLGKQAFLNLIRNPVYMGRINVKPYILKKEPAQLVMGLHPGLIAEDVFYKANDVLAGRKRNMKFHEDKTDLYPLKGFLKCPVHGTALTAYGAAGCTKRKYHYYLCPRCRSKQRHRIDDVHQCVERILAEISVSAQALNLYKSVLEKLFDKEDIERRNEVFKINTELDKNRERKNNLQGLLLDGKIMPDDYQQMKQKIEKESALLNGKLGELQQKLTPFRTYLKDTIPMLQNLEGYYKQADGKAKRKILSCIFSEKLVIQNGKVATIPFTVPVQVLLNTVKGFQGAKKKQEVEFDLLSTWAPPARLELATL